MSYIHSCGKHTVNVQYLDQQFTTRPSFIFKQLFLMKLILAKNKYLLLQ